MIQKTHAETAQIEDDSIQALFSYYLKEIYNKNYEEARNTFQSIIGKIKESTALDEIDKLYHIIPLLQKTPAAILEIDKNNRFFFKEISYKYDKYNHDYWLKIDKKFLLRIGIEHQEDVFNAGDEIIKILKKIFDYHLTNADPAIGADAEEYSSITSEALEIIARGERKLNPIMPKFLFLAVDKAVERVKASEKAIKEIGTAVGITKESRHFNYTAIGHSIRGLLSLFICFLLGSLTIVWALGLEELWGYKNILISQNPKCDDKLLNLYLCQLATLPRELLVGVVLLTGIYASLRAYFANANSGIINRHRYNALQAFKYFYSIVDKDDKSLVLQKATEAIFEHVPTGFNKHHKEGSKSSDNSAQLTPLIAASLAATTKAITKGDGS